jgi:hypothetical protein
LEVHSRDAAAERFRVAVVQPPVAGAGFAAVVPPLPAAVDEIRGEGARSRAETNSAREMKSVDDHFADWVRSPREGSPAATKRAGGSP